MTEEDAKHIAELYRLIHQIDGRLEHIRAAHRYVAKLDVWATVSSGNYPIEIEVCRESPMRSVITGALESELLRLRELRCEGLTRLGFVAPSLKERA